MRESIFRKVGRRYVEIGVYDDAAMHYPHGSHLVVSQPGGSLTYYRVEPDTAALLAASVPAREAMLDAMRDGPNTPAGRKRAILHYVTRHARRSTRGREYDVSAHFRGVTKFGVDGLDVTLESNDSPKEGAR